MNPCKVFFFVLPRSASLLVLIGSLGTSAFSAPVPLPEWVKPMASSLPKLPPDVISEVDGFCTFSDENRYLRYRPEVNAQYESINRRVVELREQVDQAMIWQYLKATSAWYNNPQRLSRLGGDRDLAAWLLPIVRFRIEWILKALYDPAQAKYLKQLFEGMEIYDIEDYLFQQGEFTDIEKLNTLKDEATKLNYQGFGLGGATGQKRLQEQVKAMQEARIRSEKQAGPMWQFSARNLIAEGVLNADVLKPRPRAQTQSAGGHLPKPLGPRKPLPQIKPLSDYPQPWMVWQIWLFLGAVSAGLLRWLFRKPKRAS